MSKITRQVSLISPILWAIFFFMLVSKTRGQDTTTQKATNPYRPLFQPTDRYGDPYTHRRSSPLLRLKDPPSLRTHTRIDTGRTLIIDERVGETSYRPLVALPFQKFSENESRHMRREYWKTRSKLLDGESAVSSRNLTPRIPLSPALDRIFGGDHIEFQFRGFATLDLGGFWQRVENPNVSARQQRSGGFEMHQQTNLGATGKIGEKMKVGINFDNNSSFDFQNQMKVEYTGLKHEMLKKIEFGNVSLPLNNSLITGSQNLFGIKTKMQFGKMNVTTIASTQRGKQSTVTVRGSSSGVAQKRPFEIRGSDYDENRHFFLGHFFRDHFEEWLSTLPQIASGVNIVRVEAYIINRQNDTETQRNVVGLMDLGETDKAYRSTYYTTTGAGLPTDNNANNLMQLVQATSQEAQTINNELDNLLGSPAQMLTEGVDYERTQSARKLKPSEFIINHQLGYISLQRRLQNDEMLAVAYQYTYNGRVYKVGELSEDYGTKEEAKVAFFKLLRPRKISIKDRQGTIIPTWDLMMKNIYNLNIAQVSQEDFEMRIIYRDDRTGIDNPQLQEGEEARTRQLISIMGLDRLNPYNDPVPDGNFDYVPNVTIDPNTGLVTFPYLEPLNTPLRQVFDGDANESLLINKYVYDTLYHTTKAEAELETTKNKFFLVGFYSSGSGKEIFIQGYNISPGSVSVFSGGSPLVEGQDYVVDYTIGKVTFLNESILNSGRDIEITFEQQDSFVFQTRSLLGSRFDYQLDEDINIGATILYYNERPVVRRQPIGSEPPRNVQYGLDLNISKPSRRLTRLVDKLPFLETKEPSQVTLSAEFAQLLPGTSNTINKEGTSFIDDFETAAKPYNLMSPINWKLAATPKNSEEKLDPSQGSVNDIQSGNRRALLAWYNIDPLFYQNQWRFKPKSLTEQDMQNHYVRRVTQQEIFPFRDRTQIIANESIFEMAYYPEERGPYNYTDQVNSDGTLRNPKTNWGGITTAVRTDVDFDKANMEYIEFWLLDPFIPSEQGKVMDGRLNANNTTGGKLVFHLGNISEDIVRDGRHGFENGLPEDPTLISGKTSPNSWGRVTTQQYINNAFSNSAEGRSAQDVGLDGINDVEEREKFKNIIDRLPSGAQQEMNADPASDNFRYPLNEYYDQRDAKLLERYKKFNGVENNSPVISRNDPFAMTGSNYPDNEDLNQDNTLSSVEEYYMYSIDLTPDQLRVGSKYIVDKITPNPEYVGNGVNWYLFRIPVRQFEQKVGDIPDFKSIRYLRTYLTGFTQPVVLRMANFRIVGNQWRRYTQPLNRDNFIEEIEPNLDNFSVSTVNIEENGMSNQYKPAYVSPIARDYDVTSTVRRRLNEQSIQLCVTGLEDGDARAIYKNVSVDLFNYKRIKMFLSAHPSGTASIEDDQLAAFIRIGTDFDQNYFEIEIPLKITPNGSDDIDQIWPDENQLDLALDELYALKVSRDRENYSLGAFYPKQGYKQVGNHRLVLLGRPDLSNVQTIMIGIRNTKSADTKPYDVCLWANELRVTGFDRTPGRATNLTLDTKLADLGKVSGSFRQIGFGYGNVQSKISERARGKTLFYSASTQLNAEKLLPKKAGVVIPVWMSYDRNVIDPQYDPANPDIRIQAALSSFETDQERKDYQALIRDETVRRSINFTNVRKIKLNPQARSHIWDIENFAFTYSYAESKHTSFNLKDDIKRNIKGAVNWQYNFSFTGFEPFQNATSLKSPYLKWIKNFNFNPLPSSLSARVDVDRSFAKLTYRNDNQTSSSSQSNYQKYLVMKRSYNVQWNFTKSLSANYTATANAIVDEPYGDINTPEKRDSLLTNLKKLGRLKNFDQVIIVNYRLPLNQFPITDWVNVDYQYKASYNWKAGPLERSANIQLGHIIQNTRDRNITGRANLSALYDKIKFLKEANTPARKPGPSPQPDQSDENNIRKTNQGLMRSIVRLIMSVRDITLNYNITERTTLPGFKATPKRVGLSLDDGYAPGFGFIWGQQDYQLPVRFGEKGWLIKNERLTTPFQQTRSVNIDGRASLMPFADFKIQLNVQKVTEASFQEIYRYDDITESYKGFSPSLVGSYKISFLAINTAFKNNSSLTSSVFQQFEENIEKIQNRFNESTNQAYDPKSQDVLIPALIAAYSGKSADEVNLVSFPKTPAINWRLDYSGLHKLPGLSNLFRSIVINHAYLSSYSVSNYTTSLEYTDMDHVGLGQQVETYNQNRYAQTINGKVVPIYVINQVVIGESFAPLMGINVRMHNNLTLRVEYKLKREVTLNVSNAQLAELHNQEWTVEVGYIKNNLKLPFRDRGRIITLKNDVTFRMGMGVVNNRVIQRKIEEVNTITRGNVSFQLRPNVTYVVNKKINLQLYFERNINDPLVTTSYRRATTRGGVKFTFNLAQ